MATEKEGTIVTDPGNTVLLPIPASTRERQTERYEILCRDLSRYLGIVNGYDFYYFKYDRKSGEVRRHGMSAVEHVEFTEASISFLKDKHILLVDNNYTSGKSFETTAAFLSTVDASSITGIFFSKTADRLDSVIQFVEGFSVFDRID